MSKRLRDKGKRKAVAVETAAPRNDLLSEIIALGGDEEDLSLIAGIDSDAEDALVHTNADESLDSQELAQFYKSLGFEGLSRPDATSDVSDSENSQSNDESSTSREQDEQEPAVVREPEVQAKASQVSDKEWLVLPHPVWHEIQLPALEEAPATFKYNADLVNKLKSQGEALLTALNEQYQTTLSPEATSKRSKAASNGMSKADKTFFTSILKSGTFADKVSALTLIVASSPLHTRTYLQQLLTLSNKKSREQSLKALRSLVDWLNEQGLPSSRKLRWFEDQPLLKNVILARSKVKRSDERQVGDVHLAVFAYEAWLKDWYLDILKVLEAFSHDTLPFIKTQTLNLLHMLLVNKPEQEQNLLRLLVNKLGDANGTVASSTSHHLLQILQQHPLMAPIIIREIASVILKAPSRSAATKKQEHSKYYGLITLNQIMLSRDQAQIAAKLLDVYFEVFQDILTRMENIRSQTAFDKSSDKKNIVEAAHLEQKEEEESKLLAAVLTGAHRALPFAKSTIKISDIATASRMDALYRLSHIGTFNSSIQALQLIHQIVLDPNKCLPDRYYRLLYDSLTDTRMLKSTKFIIYLNLLFKSLQADRQLSRVKSFVKRLSQIMLHQENVGFVIGTLHLLAKLWSKTPDLFAWAIGQHNISESGESAYDARRREPLYTHAENTCLWELNSLAHHFHPVISGMTKQLLEGRIPPAASDLEQYSLSHLLDLFSYRDAKHKVPMRGSSAMQPAAPGQNKAGRVAAVKISGNTLQEVAMNAESFWRQDQDSIALDKRFFHTYWTNKHGTQSTRRGSATNRTDDKLPRSGSTDANLHDELRNSLSDSEDVEENEIWQAIKASKAKESEYDMVSAVSDEESDDMVDTQLSADDDDANDSELLNLEEDESDIFGSEDEVEIDVPTQEPHAVEQDGPPKKKQRMARLPMFASYEDYENLLR